jgi:lipopolysaccharide transport system ATP-binding protein
MKNIAIETNNLSKCFIKGMINPNQSIKDAITGLPKKIVQRFTHGKPEQSKHWALRDINFSCQKGETLGLIGLNGSGKSTLLKILSRIIEPTEGIIKLSGRVNSLLEVGTGFHSDLSGRDNIFLNGAILGMRRWEILDKFSDIVEYSGIKDFIDMQVKYYSSGMYVRLAFAVAAYLQPEILFLDEVLAVGDEAFQKKCLKTLSELRESGTTIVFVSHDMVSMESLCDRSLLLHKGDLIASGTTASIISEYRKTQDKD